ncbi:MAG: LysR family transcriptional regulator [Bacteroidaceae bacterium]|jgi:LysR family hydrogen peroxide-inducible transcriptional activator|nr:LysR family transcriptional regulator [Bacteroidaceae bacterium]
MNLQQLEYIVALDTHRHFVNAAKACGVSQPTLSTLVTRLEEELDTAIFDRSAHPIRPTAVGEKIIEQAKAVLLKLAQIKELSLNEREQKSGKIRLGVIPTVAPYIIPPLFNELQQYKEQIDLHVSEQQTHIIVDQIRKGELDMAILATPLNNDDILEIPLYYEKFIAYVSPKEEIHAQSEIQSSLMPTEHLWVLKEGHCMRNQIFNFCESKSEYAQIYEAGSINTLIGIVDANGGYTIIPELHIPLLSQQQQTHLRPLSEPTPVREISLILRTDYVRQGLVNTIVDAVKAVIPEDMIDARLKKFAVKL